MERVIKTVRRGDSDSLFKMYRPLRFGELYGGTVEAAVPFFREMTEKRGGVDEWRWLNQRNSFFHGPSGSGKTTLAHLLGLVLNCENPQPSRVGGEKVEPCLECSSCKRILRGSMKQLDDSPVKIYNSPTLIKDDVKRIASQEIMGPRPIYGPRAVITILDECHALTFDQSQPFLINLETQPKHSFVFFITSLPDKFRKDKAMYSREAEVGLRNWTPDEVYELIYDVAFSEHKHAGRSLVENDALRYLADSSDGNSRMALNKLEKILQSDPKNGKPIPLEAVKAVFPVIADYPEELNSHMKDIFFSFYKNDLAKAVARLEELDKMKINATKISYPVNAFLKGQVYKKAKGGNSRELTEFARKLDTFSQHAFARDGDPFANLVVGIVSALSLPN